MTIPVQTGTGSYDIVLERGALQNAGQYLHLKRRVMLVTDSGVPEEYVRLAAQQCRNAFTLCIPQGESSKTMENFQSLLSAMLEADLTREDCVVAVGGGVVGDLAGFAAACYMRGIDFYNIPTTLLAQIDASIGGKTGVDFKGFKNLIGAFYPPAKVLIDPETLRTLSPRLLREGLAEMIKMSLTADPALFALLKDGTLPECLTDDVIARTVRIKTAVVERDEKELGPRRVLNFGHTVGHAIESCSGGELLHGECVALGMLPMCSAGLREELAQVLNRFGLPTAIRQDPSVLMPYILHDKKRKENGVACVLVEKPGTAELRTLSGEKILNRIITSGIAPAYRRHCLIQ